MKNTSNQSPNNWSSDPFLLFKIILFFSPIILMSFMIGSAIMSGTPFVFLFYFLLLFTALIFRHLFWMLFNPSPVTKCNNSAYLPFVFGDYKEFMTTFIFAFTIIYVFGPYFNWKTANENAVFMFVFFIAYGIYDLIFRLFFSQCVQDVYSTIIPVLGNILVGGFFGLVAEWLMDYFGLTKYMYYSNNANRPTKKIFRCGKVNK